MATEFELLKLAGGIPIVKDGGDINNPADIEWNFGMLPKTAAVEADAGPALHERFKNIEGKWDGKKHINHHEAVRKVTGGTNLKPHAQKSGTCFPAGTLILMADGTHKPIEKVKKGESVVSHTGEKRKVARTMKRMYSGTMYGLKIVGYNNKIEMTDEHPVLITSNTRKKHEAGYRPGEQKWIEAKNLKVGDRVTVPFGVFDTKEHTYDLANYVKRLAKRPGEGCNAGDQITNDYVREAGSKHKVKRKVKLNRDFGRLLGLFIAEGSSSDNRVTFTYCIDEDDYANETVLLLKKIFGLDSTLTRNPTHNTQVVRASSCLVAAFFKTICGNHTLTKHVPSEVFASSEEVRTATFRGWVDGDGDVKHKHNNRSTQIRAVTASLGLAKDMRRIALSCGVHATIATRKKEAHQTVASSDVYVYGEDAVKFTPDKMAREDEKFRCASRKGSYKTKDGMLCGIKSIEKREVKNLEVYNIEVDVDHSYVADGIVVHNCGGHAGSRGPEILQHVLVASGKRAKVKSVSHAWPYFLARREYGMLGGGDGVAGGSIPPMLKKYGVLNREEANDPYQDGGSVDAVADSWGAGRLSGTKLEALLKEAADNLVTEVVQVRSAQELADGLAAGGVGVGSDMQGYTMERDSEGFCRPSGTWAHYHVRSGVFVNSRGRKGFAYDQSWGAIPSGPLLPGYPENVFGVDWDVQDRLCRTGEWHVIFGFDLWDLEQGNVDLDWVF